MLRLGSSSQEAELVRDLKKKEAEAIIVFFLTAKPPPRKQKIQKAKDFPSNLFFHSYLLKPSADSGIPIFFF